MMARECARWFDCDIRDAQLFSRYFDVLIHKYEELSQ